MTRGLLVGRFQPFHRGHLETVVALRHDRPTEPLLLGIGSAQASYTFENPFTAGERAEMIDRALTEAEVDGWSAVPIVDLDRHALWVSHVESLLPKFDRVYTNNPLTRLLFEAANYAVESPPLVDRGRFEGAKIRAALARGEDGTTLLPPAVAKYLVEIEGTARLKLLAGEDRAAGRTR